MVRLKKKTEFIFSYKTPLKKLLASSWGIDIDISYKPILIHDYHLLDKIEDTVKRVNLIVFHTYNFLKLYLIHLWNQRTVFPKIDKPFIRAIINTISYKSDKRGRKSHNDVTVSDLLSFHNANYKQFTDLLPVCSDNLSHILEYEIITIITSIKNNIKEHFASHVKKYVDCITNKSYFIKQFKKGPTSPQYENALHRLNYNKTFKEHLFSLKTNFEHPDKQYILNMRKNLYNKDKFSKKGIYYDIKSKPFDYLFGMFSLAFQLEHLKNQEEIKEKDIQNETIINTKLFNVIPLRTNIVPKSITLDTASLLDLFYTGQNKGELYSTLVQNQDRIWGEHFRIYSKMFNISSSKKSEDEKYKFHYMIKTDGISATVMFHKSKEIEIDAEEEVEADDIKVENYKKDPIYIESLEQTKLNEMKRKKLIAIDPGYGDIIYSISNKNRYKNNKKEKYEHYKYTQAQRNFQIRKKKYELIINDLRKNALKLGLDVSEIENRIKVNSKTVKYENFKEYLKQKVDVNNSLYHYYSNPIFRKLNLNRYTNTLKSESKIIKNIW